MGISGGGFGLAPLGGVDATGESASSLAIVTWPRLSQAAHLRAQGVLPRWILEVRFPLKPQVAAHIEQYVWSSALVSSKAPIQALHMLIVNFLTFLFPPTMRHGRSHATTVRVLLQVFVLMGALRLRTAMEQKRTPAWAARVLRLLPPALQVGLADLAGSASWRAVRESCARGGQASAVYVLFTHAGLYVGKSNQERRSPQGCGVGYGDRLMEHLRFFLRPMTPGAGKARYRLLGKSLGSLGFIPAIEWPDASRALAAEFVAIQV